MLTNWEKQGKEKVKKKGIVENEEKLEREGLLFTFRKPLKVLLGLPKTYQNGNYTEKKLQSHWEKIWRSDFAPQKNIPGMPWRPQPVNKIVVGTHSNSC